MHTGIARLALLLLAALSPATALASFLPPAMLDKAADIVAIVVLFFVPITVIVIFWLVHVLPEKIAEKRQHPQKKAINTVCLLSLFFGGMLWPIAWIWAYTRPVAYRAAYGTDLHEDYFIEMAVKARDGALSPAELRHLSDELAAMEARGALPPGLHALKDEIERLRRQPHVEPAPPPPPPPAPAAPGARAGGGK